MQSQNYDSTHNPKDSEHQDYALLRQTYVEDHLRTRPLKLVITGYRLRKVFYSRREDDDKMIRS